MRRVISFGACVCRCGCPDVTQQMDAPRWEESNPFCLACKTLVKLWGAKTSVESTKRAPALALELSGARRTAASQLDIWMLNTENRLDQASRISSIWRTLSLRRSGISCLSRGPSALTGTFIKFVPGSNSSFRVLSDTHRLSCQLLLAVPSWPGRPCCRARTENWSSRQ